MSRSTPTRLKALLTCVFVVLLALACAGLVTAAALVPAPPAMLPFVVATGIGCPMLAALELPKSLAVLRRGARARRALLAEMRRYLRQLPETRHPLDG
jgi:hypothetical protein